jgi:hypothetical protein
VECLANALFVALGLSGVDVSIAELESPPHRVGALWAAEAQDRDLIPIVQQAHSLITGVRWL